MSWPPKETGAMLPAPISKKLLLSQPNSGHTFAQPCGRGIIWRQWEREAARLFSLFWRTADERHLRAFAVHVREMRGYAGRRQS